MKGRSFERKGLFFAVWAAWCAIAVPLHAGPVGLSTRFVDVTVENVPAGREARLSDLGAPRYTVQNRGAMPIDISLRVIAPPPGEAAKDCVPLPDVAWVRLEHDKMTLKPGEIRSTDILIHVPENADWAGKKFHAKILTATTNSGQLVAAAVSSHLKFTVARAEPAPRPSKKSKKAASKS